MTKGSTTMATKTKTRKAPRSKKSRTRRTNRGVPPSAARSLRSGAEAAGARIREAWADTRGGGHDRPGQPRDRGPEAAAAQQDRHPGRGHRWSRTCGRSRSRAPQGRDGAARTPHHPPGPDRQGAQDGGAQPRRRRALGPGRPQHPEPRRDRRPHPQGRGAVAQDRRARKPLRRALGKTRSSRSGAEEEPGRARLRRRRGDGRRLRDRLPARARGGAGPQRHSTSISTSASAAGPS